MKLDNENMIDQEKLLKGLEKAYKKLLEFKRKMNSELVILKEGKIVKINP